MLGLVTAGGMHCTPPPPGAQDARTVVETALDAMGGVAAWRAVASARLEGVESEFLNGVAADPARASVMTTLFTELDDLVGARWTRRVELRLPMRPTPVQFSPSGTDGETPSRAPVAFGPARLLLTALAASDLTRGADTVVGGTPCAVVRFRSATVSVFVSRATRLPVGWSALEAFPDDPTWSGWGDVITLTLYSGWSLEAGGLRYPRQLHVWRNGMVWRIRSLMGVTLSRASVADSFQTPTPRPAGALELGNGTGRDPFEVAPGVVLIPGAFNVTLVHQPEGVVVLEAPYSAAYTRLVIAEIARRFPDAPIAGVVLSGSQWPHLAGAREYVARGVRLYGSERALKTVRAMVRAPHRQVPDSEARAPREPDLVAVTAPMVLGTGDNRLMLRPAVAAGAELGAEGVVAYLRARRLLYAGDLYLPRRFEPNFWLARLAELMAVVRAGDLAVDRTFSVHLDPVSWDSLTASVDSARAAMGGT